MTKCLMYWDPSDLIIIAFYFNIRNQEFRRHEIQKTNRTKLTLPALLCYYKINKNHMESLQTMHLGSSIGAGLTISGAGLTLVCTRDRYTKLGLYFLGRRTHHFSPTPEQYTTLLLYTTSPPHQNTTTLHLYTTASPHQLAWHLVQPDNTKQWWRRKHL